MRYLRYFLWRLIFKKIVEDAVNNGMRPFTIYLITYTLMAVLGGAGFFIGSYFGGEFVGCICAIAFWVLGYYIAHVIANHSFVNYTPRKKTMPVEDIYISDKYFNPWTHIQLIYAQITIVPEISGCAPPVVWEIFLNGRKAGKLTDGSRLTFPAGCKSNVLVARNDKGILSPPFEFSVKRGRHCEVLFSEGRFEGAKDIGRMSLSNIRQSLGRRSGAGSA